MNHLQNRASEHLQAFVNGVKDSANTPAIATGFESLDRVFDGGLYEGLYIIGAISSLGKTTFVMQIADQMAQQGQDVLIFSLEMARFELMAKSISRLTLLNAGISEKRLAKTVRGITAGKLRAGYSQAEHDLIKQSTIAYSQFAENIYIVEGSGDVTAESISKTVAQHIEATAKRPVVIVDYLQLIAPHSERATDKQVVDKAVLELKRISRDRKIPVIAISSLNRMNYNESANMAAFKESGAIEYSSDVLIGMQLEGVGPKEFDVDEAKRRDPRRIEVVILKNRNGRTGDKLNFEFYAPFNYFHESGEQQAQGKRL